MSWSRGKPYAQDLRDRVFALADEGSPVCRIAAQLRVSVSYVSKALSRRRLSGETAARPQCCHVPGKLIGLQSEIAAQVAARPDATIDEMRRWLASTHATAASKGLMVTLAKLRLTHKKSPSTRPSRRAPTSPPRARPGAASSRSSIPPN